jgi:hypothetical protein
MLGRVKSSPASQMSGLTESSARRRVIKREEDGQDRIINLCLGAQSLIEDTLARLREEEAKN